MIIRNVTREDDALVQQMVYASLVRQFPRLAQLGVDQAVLDRLDLFPSSKDQGCFVAEEEGRIYGVVCLTWNGKPSPLTQIGAQALMKEFGMRKGLEIWMGLRMVTVTPIVGQCYIEHSFAEEQYREVVISGMLQHLEDLAYQGGFQEMTTYSLPEHQEEIQILTTLGFEPVEERQNNFAKRFVGLDRWIYFKKSLLEE